MLERLAGMPAMRAGKAMLAKTQVSTDGTDLVLTLDLGRSRDAAGTLAMLVAPVFARGGEATAEEPPPPAPPGTELKK